MTDWKYLSCLSEDRRNKTIHLTEAGRGEAERILQPVRQSERRAMEGLTAEERDLPFGDKTICFRL